MNPVYPGDLITLKDMTDKPSLVGFVVSSESVIKFASVSYIKCMMLCSSTQTTSARLISVLLKKEDEEKEWKIISKVPDNYHI